MFIEQARWGDCGEIQALLDESGYPSLVAPDHLSDCLVLRSGRNLVGVADMRRMGGAAVGTCLVVRPGFRRMGLGKQLGLEMLGHCQRMGFAHLFVYTDSAHFYFRSLGFVPVAGEDVPHDILAFLVDLRDGRPLVGSHLLVSATSVMAREVRGA